MLPILLLKRASHCWLQRSVLPAAKTCQVHFYSIRSRHFLPRPPTHSFTLDNVLTRSAPPLECGRFAEGVKHYEAFVSIREYGRLQKFLRTLAWQREKDPKYAACKPPVPVLIADALRHGELYPDPQVYCTCIEECGRAGDITVLHALKEAAMRHGIGLPALQHSLVVAYCEMGQTPYLVEFLNDLKEQGLELEDKTLARLVEWYASQGAVDQVEHCLAEAERRGLTDPALWAGLLKAFEAAGQENMQRHIKDHLGIDILLQVYVHQQDITQLKELLGKNADAISPVKRVIALITTYGKLGMLADVQSVYRDMCTQGIERTPELFTVLLQVYSTQPTVNLDLLIQCWDEMYNLQLRPTAAAVASVVSGFHKADNRPMARQCMIRMLQFGVPLDDTLTETLQSLNLLSFSFEMAMGYALCGAPVGPNWAYDTFDHFDIIRTMDFYNMLDSACFNLALHHAFQARRLDIVKRLLEHMRSVGCPLDRVLYTTVITGYAFAGPAYLEEACSWYIDMVNNGVKEVKPMLEALVRVCAQHKQQPRLALFMQRMDAMGHAFDETSLQTLMIAAVEQGDTDKVVELWQFAKEIGVKPNQRTRQLYESVAGGA